MLQFLGRIFGRAIPAKAVVATPAPIVLKDPKLILAETIVGAANLVREELRPGSYWADKNINAGRLANHSGCSDMAQPKNGGSPFVLVLTFNQDATVCTVNVLSGEPDTADRFRVAIQAAINAAGLTCTAELWR